MVLDGNTKLKSKAGHYGDGSSIVSSAVQFADRSFQAEKVNERNGLLATVNFRFARHAMNPVFESKLNE